MRYLALAVDYDGTLAHHGQVDAATIEALARVVASGRKLIMVTGRRLEDLATVFDHFEMFDRIVAENGAVVYRPATGQCDVLGEPPSHGFVAGLRRRGVAPIEVGHVIIATRQPHEVIVLVVIRELGLELEIISNKGAVMVLPSGINKAVGLAAALDQMQLLPSSVVAVGDAENDHDFLSLAGCSAAVANAIASLKDRADLVTVGDHGRGIQEIVEHLVANDLQDFAPRKRSNTAARPSHAKS